MLTGKNLGAAIKEALKRKGEVEGRRVTQRELASHFDVSPPSVQDWINRGTIDKAKLPELWEFFRDAVGPSHWGLSQYPTGEAGAPPGDWPFPGIEPQRFGKLSHDERLEIQGAARLLMAQFEHAKRRNVRHFVRPSVVPAQARNP